MAHLPPSGLAQRTNVLAVLSLVFGFFCCGPVALPMGVVAMLQVDKNPTQKGKGLAIAGTVLGGLGTLFWLITAMGAAVG